MLQRRLQCAGRCRGQDFADEKRMQELDLKYDIINLGGVPPRP